MKKYFITIVFTLISCVFSISQESPISYRSNINSAYSCRYSDDKDGYIHKGRITLYRVGSGQGDTFELYVKSATHYVKYKGRYYKIDGVQYVTINNIKYKTR